MMVAITGDCYSGSFTASLLAFFLGVSFFIGFFSCF